MEKLTHLVGGLVPLRIEIAQLICRRYNDRSVIGIHNCVRCSEAADVQVIEEMTEREKILINFLRTIKKDTKIRLSSRAWRTNYFRLFLYLTRSSLESAQMAKLCPQRCRYRWLYAKLSRFLHWSVY